MLVGVNHSEIKVRPGLAGGNVLVFVRGALGAQGVSERHAGLVGNSSTSR